MTNREKLYKKVMDLTCPEGWEVRSDLPNRLSIARVMQALNSVKIECTQYGVATPVVSSLGEIALAKRIVSLADDFKFNVLCKWKLTKENGSECTDNEQTDECIDALLTLLS